MCNPKPLCVPIDKTSFPLRWLREMKKYEYNDHQFYCLTGYLFHINPFNLHKYTSLKHEVTKTIEKCFKLTKKPNINKSTNLNSLLQFHFLYFTKNMPCMWHCSFFISSHVLAPTSLDSITVIIVSKFVKIPIAVTALSSDSSESRRFLKVIAWNHWRELFKKINYIWCNRQVKTVKCLCSRHTMYNLQLSFTT